MAAPRGQGIRDDLSDIKLFRLCVYYIYNHPKSVSATVRRFNEELDPHPRLRDRELRATYTWLLDSDHDTFQRFRNGMYSPCVKLCYSRNGGVKSRVLLNLHC